MFCKNCGYKLSGDEKFCEICGQQIDSTAIPFSEYPQSNNTTIQLTKPTVAKTLKLDKASMVALIAAIVMLLTLFAANLFDLNCDCKEQDNTFSVSVFGDNEIKGYHIKYIDSDNDEFEHDINTALTISFVVIASLIAAAVISLFMQRYNWMHAFSLICFIAILSFLYLSVTLIWITNGTTHSVDVTGGWILLGAGVALWLASATKLVKSSNEDSKSEGSESN